MALSRRRFLSGVGALGAAVLGGRTPSSEESSQDRERGDTSETNSDKWPVVNADLENTSRKAGSRAPDHNLNTVMETEESNFDPNSYTVMDEGKIYVGIPFQDALKAFDRQTGDKEWETGVGGSVYGPIAVGENSAYVAPTSNGELLSLDKDTGEVVNQRDIDSAAGVHVSDSGDVFVPQSTGNVAFFDEDLSNRRVYDDSDPEAINIARETLVEDSWGRTVYVERGDSDSASARILDPETAAVVDEVSVGGNAEDGGAYVNDMIVYHEGESLVAHEVTDSGFGEQAWSVQTGRSEISPVVFDDKVFDGSEDTGEIFEIDVETGDYEVIDTMDGGIYALVASEHTLFVGDGSSEEMNINAYDLETGELVSELHEGFLRPAAVADGNLFVESHSQSGISVVEKEGEYREVDPGEPDVGYEMVSSGVAGDEVVLSPEVSGGDPVSYQWKVFNEDDKTVAEEEFSDAQDFSFVEDLDADNVYEAVLTVEDADGGSASASSELNLEKLQAALNTDAVSVEGQDSFGFTYEEDDAEAVDEVIYEITDGDTVVESGTFTEDPLKQEVTVDPESLGEKPMGIYSVEVEYRLAENNQGNWNTRDSSYSFQVTPPSITGDKLPKDVDGDGVYEDVDGDGQFDIFDVQAFFNHFDDDTVQQYAEQFDFDQDGEINIFDVQALFNKLK